MKNKYCIYICAASIALFALLTIHVLNGNMQSFNDIVYGQIALVLNPLLTKVMIIISGMGDWYSYVPIVLLLLISPKCRVKIGVPMAVALSFSESINMILKNLFAVARPNIHRLVHAAGYGFPSGHSMNAVVFAGLCAFVLIRYGNKKPLFKMLVVLISCIFIFSIGFSRIYLGVHTATDVLGGYLAGMAVLAASMLVQNKR